MKKRSSTAGKGLGVRKIHRMGKIDFARPEDRERFRMRLMAETVIDPSGCWLWVGAKVPDGYGKVYVNGAHRPVHRAAYEALVRIPAKGILVRHKCDVRNCWNLEHLEEGTPTDNCIDCLVRGRHRSGRTSLVTPAPRKGRTYYPTMQCRNGHPYSTETTATNKDKTRRCLICQRLKAVRYRKSRASHENQSNNVPA